MIQEVNASELSSSHGLQLTSLFQVKDSLAEFCTVVCCVVQAMGTVLFATKAVHIGPCPPILWLHF